MNLITTDHLDYTTSSTKELRELAQSITKSLTILAGLLMVLGLVTLLAPDRLHQQWFNLVTLEQSSKILSFIRFTQMLYQLLLL